MIPAASNNRFLVGEISSRCQSLRTSIEGFWAVEHQACSAGSFPENITSLTSVKDEKKSHGSMAIRAYGGGCDLVSRRMKIIPDLQKSSDRSLVLALLMTRFSREDLYSMLSNLVISYTLSYGITITITCIHAAYVFRGPRNNNCMRKLGFYGLLYLPRATQP